jgi:hypothetical protein
VPVDGGHWISLAGVVIAAGSAIWSALSARQSRAERESAANEADRAVRTVKAAEDHASAARDHVTAAREHVAATEAGLVPHEDFTGAEAVPVGAPRGRVGDPLPGRRLNQLAEHT